MPGIHSYTVAEGINLRLGQKGFKELTSAGNTGDGTFCAFFVTGASAGDDVTISATCHIGDDMTEAKVISGSWVYGSFKKITTSAHSSGDVHVLCYYG